MTLAQENAALVRSEEVVALSRQWTTFRGRPIGTDEIRAWYQQVDSLRDQRILFELLKRTRVFSEAHVRERLKNAHALIRGALPEFVIRPPPDRRKDVVLTYVDGEGKSGASYASLYAEENAIAAECVIPPGGFRLGFDKHVKKNGPVAALVIMDDIATGRSLSENVRSFLNEFGDLLDSVIVRVVTLVATESAQSVILKNLKRVQHIDVDFRTCEILPKEAFAFPEGATVWSSEEEEERAKALCVDLGSKIYKQNPLGYGGLGLLVYFQRPFPTIACPYFIHIRDRGAARLGSRFLKG